MGSKLDFFAVCDDQLKRICVDGDRLTVRSESKKMATSEDGKTIAEDDRDRVTPQNLNRRLLVEISRGCLVDGSDYCFLLPCRRQLRSLFVNFKATSETRTQMNNLIECYPLSTRYRHGIGGRGCLENHSVFMPLIVVP